MIYGQNNPGLSSLKRPAAAAALNVSLILYHFTTIFLLENSYVGNIRIQPFPFWILTHSHSEFLQKVLLATPILMQIIGNEMKVYKIFEGRLSLSSSYYAFENY